LENLRRLACGHAAVVVFIVALFGLGVALLRLFGPGRTLARADRRILAVVLGAAAGIGLLLGAGLCGLWYPAAGWVVALAGCVLACRGSRGPRGRERRSSPEWWAVASAVIAGLAVLAVAAASLDFDSAEDALVYHLSIPARFAAGHRAVGLAELYHSSFPQGGPMLYGWLLLLGGEPAVRAWRPWLVAGLCLLVYRVCVRAARPAAGLLAAGLVATLPYTFWLGPATMPDLETCAFILAAVLALQHASGGMCVTLAAAACTIKYQALFAVPGLALVGARRPLRRVLVALALVLAALGPWWGRNAAVTGNPVFPYASRVFPSFVPRPASVGPRLESANRSFLAGRAGEIPLLPWRLSTVGRGAPLGPLFLVGAPLLLLVRPLGPAAFPAAVAGLTLACWVPVSHNGRYALAGWVLLAVAIALAAEEARRRRPGRARGRGRGIAAAALSAFLVLEVTGLARAWAAVGPRTAAYLAGRDTPAARWARTERFPIPADALDRVAPPGARVLVSGDTHGGYWGRPTVWGSLFDVPAAEGIVKSSRTGAEAAKRFRQIAPYVYVSDPAAGSAAFDWGTGCFAFSARDEAVAAAAWGRWMDPVASSPAGTVWRVRGRPARGLSRAPVPVVFRSEAFRRAYGPWTAISWDGAGGRAGRTVPR